jgi:hypothetical protein
MLMEYRTGPARERLAQLDLRSGPQISMRRSRRCGKVSASRLPCFVGDADPLLERVPDTDLHLYGPVWLLTEGETRKTKRVRRFTEFISGRLAAYAPLLAGLSVSRD